MKRAGKGQRAGMGNGRGRRLSRSRPPRWRPAVLGILAVSLLPAVGCSADAGAGDSRIGSAPPAVEPVPARPAATAEAPTSAAGHEPSPTSAGETAAGEPSRGPAAAGEPTRGPAAATARAALEEALRRAIDGGPPGTEQLLGALVAAGFAAGDVQVTAGRTPTGLAADAVEVGVNRGGECLVAQVRGGAVSVTVLPVLADGRCLVGTTGP